MADQKSRITVLLRSEETAGALALVENRAPAGFERYFARLAAERQGVDPPDWSLQPLPPVEILGPQIGAS